MEACEDKKCPVYLEDMANNCAAYEALKKCKKLKTEFDSDGGAKLLCNGLLPCPFCGDKEVALSWTDCGENIQDGADIVICGRCGTTGPWGKDEEHATKLWNERKADKKLKNITEIKDDCDEVHLPGDCAFCGAAR